MVTPLAHEGVRMLELIIGCEIAFWIVLGAGPHRPVRSKRTPARPGAAGLRPVGRPCPADRYGATPSGRRERRMGARTGRGLPRFLVSVRLGARQLGRSLGGVPVAPRAETTEAIRPRACAVGAEGSRP